MIKSSRCFRHSLPLNPRINRCIETGAPQVIHIPLRSLSQARLTVCCVTRTCDPTDISVTSIAVQDMPHFGELIKLAGFDFIAYEASSHYHVSVIPEACQTSLDLVFLLDASGSVELPWYGGRPGNFNDEILSFVKEFTTFFTIGENDTRVGVVTYSSSAEVAFHLNSFSNHRDVEHAIDNIPYARGDTRTSSGLNGT
eukprot:m.158824 g.158824  ORF g.158824 m.158824 type:complete len:198 (+) comp17985_c0_seq1:207-800(+)